MGLQLTSDDQVLALAPDSSAASAGKKLAQTKHWKSMGQNTEALWGECQGSGKDPYQVRVDLANLAITCSCPSRKLPCKHALGLLLITVDTPKVVPTKEPPEWVTSWLAKRAAVSKRKEAKETPKAPGTPPTAAHIKNAEKRVAQMTKGLDQLDLWLHDLIRNGLASVESQPHTFWENQKAKMVDAQMPGIGNRVLRLAEIPHASSNWPEKLLAELGKLTLLTHSFRQIHQLEPALQLDIRQLVGEPIKQEEVSTLGQAITDDWLILGQRVSTEDKLRRQATWMLGTQTEQEALILQFAFGMSPFIEVFPLGVRQCADLTFWPGASLQRARVEGRRGEIVPLREPLPGVETIEGFFKRVAKILARQPWQERFLCTLRNVTPVCHNNGSRWYIRDTTGAVLPLAQSQGQYWRLLALAGGHPVDFAAEWDGETLLPLGMLVDNTYYLL